MHLLTSGQVRSDETRNWSGVKKFTLRGHWLFDVAEYSTSVPFYYTRLVTTLPSGSPSPRHHVLKRPCGVKSTSQSDYLLTSHVITKMSRLHSSISERNDDEKACPVTVFRVHKHTTPVRPRGCATNGGGFLAVVSERVELKPCTGADWCLSVNSVIKQDKQ